jgi:hypothetical protein
MFRVDNADFIADKLASELLPDQEQREVYMNAEEAVRRRFEVQGVDSGGRIEFDVDWPLHGEMGEWHLCCADNGDGMSHVDLEKYTTTLAVEGANKNQSITGNQGMGLKIAGPTRHKRGVLIRSLRDDEAWMVQVGWDGEEYGLIPIGPDGEVVMPVGKEMFPDFVLEQGSGSVVTFLGNDEGDNTFKPPGRPKGWLFKYLHQRFFRLSEGGIEVFVRVPSGDEPEWPGTRAEADERQRGEGRSFNLSRVRGTATRWDEASANLGDEFRGFVDLPGDPAEDEPAARLHWWVFPEGGVDVSTRTASPGSVSVLFQNELHDWQQSNQANAYFARLGVLFGKSRIGFILEPLGSTISSDFARAHVLIGGTPVFQSDAWLTWAEQFRIAMPEKIKQTMAEEQARLQHEDPDRARRIQNRLKDVMQLLRPRRFRRDENGNLIAGGPPATGSGGSSNGSVVERSSGQGRRRKKGAKRRGIGAVLTQVDGADQGPAQEVFSLLKITPQWVTEKDAETFAIVNGNSKGLHDRAAALAGEDGVTADILLLNLDFRGYQTLVASLNDWANPDGNDDVSAKIETSVQEWIEQKLVESVNGLRQLENGSTWVPSNFDDALSPVALTAAFMADRYHTLREVKRQIGSLRTASVGS